MSLTHVYNHRFLLLPIATPVIPRNDLNIPSSAEPDALSRKLHAFRRSFAGKDFWAERTALDRLRYKNSNQHKGSLHFRKLLQVRRLLRRLFEVDLEKLLRELLDIMHPNRTKRSHGRWECLPSRLYMYYVLARLMGAYVLLLRASTALRETYQAFRAVASQTYFMAISVVVLAACSRLHILGRHILRDISACYALLWTWRDVIPVRSDDPTFKVELPSSLSPELFPEVAEKDAATHQTHMPSEDSAAEDSTDIPQTADDTEITISAISDSFWSNSVDNAIPDADIKSTRVLSTSASDPLTATHKQTADGCSIEFMDRPAAKRKALDSSKAAEQNNPLKADIKPGTVSRSKAARKKQKKSEIDDIFGALR